MLVRNLFPRTRINCSITAKILIIQLHSRKTNWMKSEMRRCEGPKWLVLFLSILIWLPAVSSCEDPYLRTHLCSNFHLIWLFEACSSLSRFIAKLTQLSWLSVMIRPWIVLRWYTICPVSNWTFFNYKCSLFLNYPWGQQIECSLLTWFSVWNEMLSWVHILVTEQYMIFDTLVFSQI